MPIDGMVARWLRSTGVYFVSVLLILAMRWENVPFLGRSGGCMERGGACDKERRSPHKSPSRKVKLEIYLWTYGGRTLENGARPCVCVQTLCKAPCAPSKKSKEEGEKVNGIAAGQHHTIAQPTTSDQAAKWTQHSALEVAPWSRRSPSAPSFRSTGLSTTRIIKLGSLELRPLRRQLRLRQRTAYSLWHTQMVQSRR